MSVVPRGQTSSENSLAPAHHCSVHPNLSEVPPHFTHLHRRWNGALRRRVRFTGRLGSSTLCAQIAEVIRGNLVGRGCDSMVEG